ncbi:MAG: rubrerythrin family protein [Deltaproteobacteria bacterium]|nr:rubrerythrin family protein [Deltaproteobacteria bacterium]MBI4794238.1 rubrerythrin family protein [Deltaproteobacteria bacterium]
MEKTVDNLKEAFAGESQANRRYLAFAAKAEQEGYAQIARLFRAAAAAETVHAHNHLKVLKGVRSTAENLQEAIDGETSEFREMYPRMITAAQAEGNKEAERTFTFANEVEKTHAALFQKALKNMADKTTVDYYVCSICGHTVAGEPPDTCPVCKAVKKFFNRVD